MDEGKEEPADRKRDREADRHTMRERGHERGPGRDMGQEHWEPETGQTTAAQEKPPVTEVPPDAPWEDEDADPFEDAEEGLLPPERFPQGYHEATELPPRKRGPGSEMLRAMLICKTAGWWKHPTAAEAYEAFRAERPDTRQNAIMEAVVGEGNPDWLAKAWHEGAFTWPQVIRFMRSRQGWPAAYVQWINSFEGEE